MPRRRNGKQQACEPRRKRKMACDHTLPTCQRCKRRKTSGECVYLAAPMTRRPIDSLTVTPETSTSGTPLMSVQNISPGKITHLHEDVDTSMKPAGSSSLFSRPAAFHGPTSFSAVFLENRSRLESGGCPYLEGVDDPSGRNLEDPSATYSEDHIDVGLLRSGVKILRSIPDKATCDLWFSRYVNPNDGPVRLVARSVSRSLWTTYEHHLTSRQPEALQSLTRRICKNTTYVLQEEDDPAKWTDSFSGENLRWEGLGILFTYWTFGVMSSPENGPAFVDPDGLEKHRGQLMLELKQSASSCIAMCKDSDCANTVLVLLLYKHMLLESHFSGDASLKLWRLMGDLASVTTSIGLHNDADSSHISFGSEMRRRIYAAVFNVDKVIATFNGRPPFLSSRYSSTRLPLDIHDEDLLSGEPEISRVIATQDANGWSTDGRLKFTMIVRARNMFAFLRDEILEITLGPVRDSDSARLLDLKQRSNSTYSQFPSVIVYQTTDFSKPHLTSSILYTRLLIRLEHLQNLFLLERLLVKSGHVSGQNLLDVGKEMLSLTVMLWKDRERFEAMRHDFEWLVMFYAVPASGMLCVELLKQAQDRTHDRLVMSRSEAIQDLSTLVAFLDWVKPSAPNADLCCRVRHIVARVLDQILDPPMSQPQPSEIENGGQLMGYDFELPSDLPDFEDLGSFALLDTFEWLNPTMSNGVQR